MCSFVEMLAGQEKPLFRNDSLFICSPEAKKALTLLVDLVHTYHLTPPQVTQFKEMNSYDYFVRHQGIFLRGWPNFLRDYQSARGSLPVTGRIVKAPLPHFSGHPPVSILGGWNLMISKYSTQKKEALLFVKFLLSEEAQKVMYEEGGYLPVNNLLYDDQHYTQEHPDLAFYQQLMKTGVQRPVAEDYTKMSDIISEYLRQAINKNVTPEQALARASEKIRAEER